MKKRQFQLKDYAIAVGVFILAVVVGIFLFFECVQHSIQENSKSVWNRMVFGHNTSTIDEEFPTPTPVPPGKSVVKRVKIRNEGSVACYIRAALIFSEPIEAIEGLDTENWVKGEDDYYYYKKPVSEGESTTELFTGIRVAKEMEQKELEVLVYEESVQIQKGNMVFHGYREAWDAYERGGQT